MLYSEPTSTPAIGPYHPQQSDQQPSPLPPNLPPPTSATAEMAFAINHLPEISPVSDYRRRVLLTDQLSLHVSLPEELNGFKPEITHLHFNSPTIGGQRATNGSRKMDLILSYSRAIILECGDKQQLSLGEDHIGSKKFSYQKVLRPKVEVFADTPSTKNTKWSLVWSKHDQWHEALRRFFCLQGPVPNGDMLPGNTKVRIRYGSGPFWLQKVAAHDRKVCFLEARDPKTCELCAPKKQQCRETTPRAVTFGPANSHENLRLPGPEAASKPTVCRPRGATSLPPPTQILSQLFPEPTTFAQTARKRKRAESHDPFPAPLLRYEGPNPPTFKAKSSGRSVQIRGHQRTVEEAEDVCFRLHEARDGGRTGFG